MERHYVAIDDSGHIWAEGDDALTVRENGFTNALDAIMSGKPVANPLRIEVVELKEIGDPSLN